MDQSESEIAKHTSPIEALKVIAEELSSYLDLLRAKRPQDLLLWDADVEYLEAHQAWDRFFLDWASLICRLSNAEVIRNNLIPMVQASRDEWDAAGVEWREHVARQHKERKIKKGGT